jgi:adenylate kinase family enzyme
LEGLGVQRICIIGSPGSGKSTLAKKIGRLLDIEVIHLDTLFWQPGWISVSQEELKEAQQKHLIKDRWIIDGTYSSVWQPRLEKADTIIFLDFPKWICLYRVLRRYWKNRNQTRSDMGNGCPEKIDMEFFQFIWNYPKGRRLKVLQTLQKNEEKQIVILQNSRQVAQFLTTINKKMIPMDSPSLS